MRNDSQSPGPTARLDAAMRDPDADPDVLVRAYREAALDLARARSDPARAWREEGLNRLVGRAHARLFRERTPPITRGVEFLSRGFPQLVRAQLAHTLLAGGFFVLAALLTWFTVSTSPDTAADLLPPATLDRIGAWIEEGRWLADVSGSSAPLVAFDLFQHNAWVAAEMCASGILVGLGTAWSLLRNGAITGTIFGVVGNADALPLLLTFMAPHGALEFPAIFLAGGAGLRLGQGLLQPGERSRREALIVTAREVAAVMFGVLLLLAAAALVEAFVSPTLPSTPAAIGICVTLLGAQAFWFSRGRVAVSPQTGPAETISRAR